MNAHKGWFSIVQFCPDPNRLESANIGVLLFCPDLQFLDVRMASDNQRIIKFFGSKQYDFAIVNSFKKGLRERLHKERENIANHEQLVDFADRRANQIRISAPRSIRVSEPSKQLDNLFKELVGKSMVRQPRMNDRLAEALEQPSLRYKLYKSVPIEIPVDGKQMQIPYAFQNGRFNLIKPVRFHAIDPLQTAYRYAVEGDSLYETKHQLFGELKLLVVGSFPSKNDENRAVVSRVLKNHHVSLYSIEEMDQLVQEILTTAKDRADIQA